jgi:hypothetical protein
MVGHAKASMTLETYADLFDEDLDDVADRLNEAIQAAADGFESLTWTKCPELLKLCGASENRTPDLLDANETNWTFVAADRVDFVNNQQVMRLATLAA